MRRAAVLFVTVSVLAVFCAILLVGSLSVVQRVTYVSHVRGPVEIREPGAKGFRSLTQDAQVRTGTVIRTGGTGRALLHWADGTRLRLGVNTTLTIRECRFDKRSDAAQSLFDLDVGTIWVNVVKALAADSKFEINTPTATAGVRGTTFAVEVAPNGESSVRVYEGEVAVQAGSQPLGVRRGQAVAVNVGGTTTVRDLSNKEMEEGLAGDDEAAPDAVTDEACGT